MAVVMPYLHQYSHRSRPQWLSAVPDLDRVPVIFARNVMGVKRKSGLSIYPSAPSPQ